MVHEVRTLCAATILVAAAADNATAAANAAAAAKMQLQNCEGNTCAADLT